VPPFVFWVLQQLPLKRVGTLFWRYNAFAANEA
jgi:hypothetical protein